jgi:hypothetical protein
MNYSELGSELLPSVKSKLNLQQDKEIQNIKSNLQQENISLEENLELQNTDNIKLENQDELQIIKPNENNIENINSNLNQENNTQSKPKVSFNLDNNEEYEIPQNLKKRKNNNDNIVNLLGKDLVKESLNKINNNNKDNENNKKEENTFLSIIKSNFQTILFIILLLIILIVFIKYNNKQKEILKNITDETIKQQKNL